MILRLVVWLALAPLAMAAQQKSYTIVFLNKKPAVARLDEAESKKLMDGHMTNIQRLADEGKLLAAGPFDGGGGLFIFNTTSLDEAQAWVNTDPAVQANRWDIEILPYTPRTGSICPVSGEPEMISYGFVRFNAIVDKFTASNYPAIIRHHDEFLREAIDPADIVTEAIFGPNEGGILILRRELPADAFVLDPGVQQGLIHVDIKKLYIPRTSFCEQ